MGILLRVKDLRKEDILRGISFDIEEGEIAAVMGPSGAGKSTLLYNVSGMDRPDEGEVTLDGTEITGLNEDEKAALRLRRMGFVFQQMNMLDNLNIIDNIALPAVHADRKLRKEHYEKAKTLMEGFHIGGLAERRTSDVSGGQLQRACICRSMIMDPKIIFADEPTGALNQTAASEVMDAFLSVNRRGTTILMITHDSRIAAMCERVLYILDGEIRGELRLGKSSAADSTAEFRERAQKTAGWLKNMGW